LIDRIQIQTKPAQKISVNNFVRIVKNCHVTLISQSERSFSVQTHAAIASFRSELAELGCTLVLVFQEHPIGFFPKASIRYFRTPFGSFVEPE